MALSISTLDLLNMGNFRFSACASALILLKLFEIRCGSIFLMSSQSSTSGWEYWIMALINRYSNWLMFPWVTSSPISLLVRNSESHTYAWFFCVQFYYFQQLNGSVGNGDKSHFCFMVAISACFKIGNLCRILAKFTCANSKKRSRE